MNGGVASDVVRNVHADQKAIIVGRVAPRFEYGRRRRDL
jgi:hypothetical protein